MGVTDAVMYNMRRRPPSRRLRTFAIAGFSVIAVTAVVVAGLLLRSYGTQPAAAAPAPVAATAPTPLAPPVSAAAEPSAELAPVVASRPTTAKPATGAPVAARRHRVKQRAAAAASGRAGQPAPAPKPARSKGDDELRKLLGI